MTNFGANFIYFLSLTLIGTGCWMIYPPSGFIVLGALIWIDVQSSMLMEEIRELVKKDVS